MKNKRDLLVISFIIELESLIAFNVAIILVGPIATGLQHLLSCSIF